MSKKWVQFQPGMSIDKFHGVFGSEAQCEEAVRRMRWPDGFECPSCSARQYWMVRSGVRQLYQCAGCRHQTSLTAGTMMENTKLPLTKWFLAIYLISQAKTGLSALALKRHLGVSYRTAWLVHHKIMLAMAEADDHDRLSHMVQLDDAYLGGERPLVEGEAGRGSPNKVPFVAAVSMNDAGHPIALKLSPVSGFTSDAIAAWAKRSLLPDTLVFSDGLGCFSAVTEVGCRHQPTVVGKKKPRDLPQFRWVNTVLGNIKRSLGGAHHAFKFGKYARVYLAAYAYRFNRRFDLHDLVIKLLANVTRSAPVSEKKVREA